MFSIYPLSIDLGCLYEFMDCLAKHPKEPFEYFSPKSRKLHRSQCDIPRILEWRVR